MPKPGTAIFLEKSKFHLKPHYQQLATVNLARIENLKTACALQEKIKPRGTPSTKMIK